MASERRFRLDLNIEAEKAIHTAIQEVEKLGADPLLTDVIIMLGKAKNLLSDFVDENTLTPLSKSIKKG